MSLVGGAFDSVVVPVVREVVSLAKVLVGIPNCNGDVFHDTVIFEPGIYTTKPFVHEYWEEVYLVSGDLTVGNDERGEGGTSFSPNTYASRPPGAYHGPFKSRNGCLLFEIHYFDPV